MSKFTLPIDSEYLSGRHGNGGWGLAQGLREILQNGRDAEIEHKAPLTVRWRRDTQTLVVTNEGCILPLRALLIGYSTKRDRTDTAGQYGEGLAFGMLALVRAGHAVKIRTGSEVWIPRLEMDERVGRNVLVFEIKEGRKDEDRVAVEVGGISEEVYKGLFDKFLFLTKRDEAACALRVETSDGALLLDTKQAGALFVKGIWVATDPELRYGYDFRNVETDRDRKMIDSYDQKSAVRRVWQEAVAARPDIFRKFLMALKTEAKDVEGVDAWNSNNFPDNVRNAIAADFSSQFGENAVPVASLGDSQDIGHLGKTGVIVPKPLLAMLESTMGTLKDRKVALAKQPEKQYVWTELSLEEQSNLTSAITLVCVEEPVSMADISVVDFRDGKLMGMFVVDNAGKRIYIAKRLLVDRDETLTTLVHEVAHKAGGGDGEKAHVANIERIWTGIVKHLRDMA